MSERALYCVGPIPSLVITHGYKLNDIDRMYELEKLGFAKNFRWSKKDFVAALKSCDTVVGVYSDQILGYVIGEDEGEDTGHLVSVVVDPAYQGRGFGRTLMEAVEEFYLEKGKKRIKLEVHVDNPAQTFYFKAGYRATGVRPRYYANGSMAITMVKPIKK